MENKIKLIQSVERALAIIDCFSEKDDILTLAEISNKMNLNINTTRGLVNTLVHFQYLTKLEKINAYKLGLKFLIKAKLAYSTKVDEIRSLIRNDMQLLADQTESSIRLQIIKNYEVDSIEIANPLNTRYILKTRLNFEFPFYATSTGKLILYYLDPTLRKDFLETLHWEKYTDYTLTSWEELSAEMEFIQKEGYARENNELGYGISSIAIPILIDDQLSFTISATANEFLISKNHSHLLQKLRSIALKVEESFQQ